MSSAKVEEFKLSLKVMVNQDNTKVLFAEADSDFADILLSFLTLPLGRILYLFKSHYGDRAPVIGSLTTLYNGLANLDGIHFWRDSGREMLLNPGNSFRQECASLKLNLQGSQSTQSYTDEGFTKKTVTFLITDDLNMAPNTSSFMSCLLDMGIRDIDGIEQRILLLGLNEIIDLLKGSLLSQTPLTDLILHRELLNQAFLAKCKTSTSLPHVGPREATSDSKKFVIKTMLQKSSHKLLFVQSEDDFVDFLFSLLTIPLSCAGHLLGNSFCLGSISNMYKSIASFDGNKHLRTLDKKTKLLNPALPPWCVSNRQIFPLKEEERSIYYGNMKGGDSYIKSPGMFMVKDDLSVSPWSMVSSIAFLNEMKVPLHDVEEIEVQIGMKEGLRILDACLSSKGALTDALKPFLKM